MLRYFVSMSVGEADQRLPSAKPGGVEDRHHQHGRHVGHAVVDYQPVQPGVFAFVILYYGILVKFFLLLFLHC